jgi:cell division protein FtsL
MAVIGARPAGGIGVLGRRSRPPKRAPQRARTSHAGAGRRARQAGIAGFLAMIVVAAGLGLFYLSQSSHVAAVGYQIDDLQSQLAAARSAQEQLVLQVGAARSPTQVLQRARQLGLVPIDPRNVSFASRPASPSTDLIH